MLGGNQSINDTSNEAANADGLVLFGPDGLPLPFNLFVPNHAQPDSQQEQHDHD